MTDTSETLAQRAAQSLVDLNEAILEGSGDLAVECAAVITALSVANAQLERERDYAWGEMKNAQAYMRAETSHAEHAEAQRDAANAALAKAEGERDTLETLRPIWAQGWSDDSTAAQVSAAALAQIWQVLGAASQTEAMQRLAALTPAPEAPKDGE